ncbi:MAG: hypothetical protein ABI461_15265 [Polyangiaceae bacterium]
MPTLVAFLAVFSACKHGEPPTWSGDSEGGTATGAAGASGIFDLPAGGALDGGTATSSDAGSGASTSNEAVDAGDPGLLPQTNDKPDATTVAFNVRMQLVWSAITADDVERALPAFFPESAYEQTKAIAHPEADWRRRLVRNFKRDIHALHVEVASTGVGTSARLVRVDLPDKRARWVEPGDEGNKTGYYRVYGTQLIWAAEGREHASPITSLISWRGEWYIVHLTGFK